MWGEIELYALADVTAIRTEGEGATLCISRSP
jgi:hypothetical protein